MKTAGYTFNMRSVTAAVLKEQLGNGEPIFLLDVRESFEHEEFNIGGVLIPLGEVTQRFAEIPADREVVVYCRKGIRSQIAIQRLQDKYHFTNLVNLTGGMEAWKQFLNSPS